MVVPDHDVTHNGAWHDQQFHPTCPGCGCSFHWVCLACGDRQTYARWSNHPVGTCWTCKRCGWRCTHCGHVLEPQVSAEV